MRSFLLVLLFSVSQANAVDIVSLQPAPNWLQQLWTKFNSSEAYELALKVTDESGLPIQGALIQVGPTKDQPFIGNQQVTDSNGSVLFANEALQDLTNLLVTVNKPGFGTLTVAGVNSRSLQLSLVKQLSDRDFGYMRGQVLGFPPGYGSTTLELGVFMPAFRPESLINFDPAQFISSYIVKINVFGEREVPGNIVFPTQRKRYGLIPFTLSKPEFIMPLKKGTNTYMTALVGAVGVSDAIGAMQSEDYLAAVNLSSLTHVAWTNRRVEVESDETFDLTANQEIQAAALKAELKNIPPSADVVAVAVVDPLGKREDFVSTDVKAAKKEEIANRSASFSLGTLKRRLSGERTHIFAGIFDRNLMQDEEAKTRWLVGSLQTIKSGRSEAKFPAFFSPLKALSVSTNKKTYRFSSAANGNLKPDFVVLNIVSQKRNAQTQGLTRNLLWSAVMAGDSTQFTLPDIGKAVLPRPTEGETFLWEVIAVKSKNGRSKQGLLRDLSQMEHVASVTQAF